MRFELFRDCVVMLPSGKFAAPMAIYAFQKAPRGGHLGYRYDEEGGLYVEQLANITYFNSLFTELLYASILRNAPINSVPHKNSRLVSGLA